jgi:hypothetical protein
MVSQEMQDLEVLRVRLERQGRLDRSDHQAHKDLLDQPEPEVRLDRLVLKG